MDDSDSEDYDVDPQCEVADRREVDEIVQAINEEPSLQASPEEIRRYVILQ